MGRRAQEAAAWSGARGGLQQLTINLTSFSLVTLLAPFLSLTPNFPPHAVETLSTAPQVGSSSSDYGWVQVKRVFGAGDEV